MHLATNLFFGLLLAVSASGQVPRPSPDFSFKMLDGRTVKLSDYSGKLVALACISTTCPHCQEFTKVLNEVQKEYGPKGVQVLGVAFNDNAVRVLPEFIRQYQPGFPMGYASPDAVYGYLQLSFMKQNFVPNLAFIDQKGIIQAQYAGADPFFKNEKENTRAKLDELLKEFASKKSVPVKSTRDKKKPLPRTY